MSRQHGWIGAGLSLMMVGSVLWWHRPMVRAASPSTAPTVRGVLEGSASCSGRACHGASEPAAQGMQRDEYTTWVYHDPHVTAYRVLLNATSQRMMKNLRGAAATKSATEDVRCLACHVVPQATADAHRDLRAEGVGCEACHGPARDWLGPHAEPGWAKLSPTAKRAKGMVPVERTRDLVQQCVGCHVGAPASPATGAPLRDVNHDLIAAGHPRLNFEFVSHLVNLPAHWRQSRHDDEEPARTLRQWALGQVETARAAVRLLDDRAAGASDRPWPELAEYDCAACHHPLQATTYRREEGYASKRKGHWQPSRWPFVMLPAAPLAANLNALEPLQRELGQPFPDRDKLRPLALALDEKLNLWGQRLEDWPQSAAEMAAWRPQLQASDQTSSDIGWDQAQQRVLAARVLEWARRREQPIALQASKAGQVLEILNREGQSQFQWSKVKDLIQALP